jgi:renalase
MYKVVIIGAGVAGLNCARQLQRQLGPAARILLIDKSRGWGGRLATRRLGTTHADHGVCYLKASGDSFQQELQELLAQGVIRCWTRQIHNWDGQGPVQVPLKESACYVAASGATAIAKYWAKDLEIIGERTVTAIQPLEPPALGWQVMAADWSVTAQQVVLALPPAQAAAIVQGVVDQSCLAQLQAVTFTPSIAVMAIYDPQLLSAAANLGWQGINCQRHPSLAWVGLDSSKQLAPTQPVVVLQSNPEFASQHFDATDLMAVGQQLLAASAALAPWLGQPQLYQVQRWAYAFAQNPLPQTFLSAQTAAPLYFCGDWCGGNRVEAAYLSGLATAAQIWAGVSSDHPR